MLHAGRNRSRSRAPPPRRSARHIQVEYVSGYGSNTHYDSYDSASSDSEYFSEDRFSHPSIHIRANVSSRPQRRHQERLPRAPPAPGSEPRSPFESLSSVTPSLDSSSDSRSSHGSSHPYDHSTLSPVSDVTPEIVDSSGYGNRGYYTGAYRYAYGTSQHHSSHQTAPAPARVKQVPVAVGPHHNVIIAEPEPEPIAAPAPPARGGPMAGSYLAANAPAPDPAVVEVKEAIPAHDTYSQGPRPIPSVHPVIPLEYINDNYLGSSDDDEEKQRRYMQPRKRGRPRHAVRHVAVCSDVPPPRSLSRPRSQSRSRAYRHNHHHNRHSHRKEREKAKAEADQRTADLQAQIDALTTRLMDVIDNPYATEVIAAEGIKFDPLITDAKGNK